MSDTSKRRRRDHAGPISPRTSRSGLIQIEAVRRSRIGRAELAACGAVVIVAIALSVLIWIVTDRAVQEQRTEIRERSEQTLLGQAATMAETVAHELLLIDQSLTIIQAAWKSDSETVDLVKLQDKMPALTAVADDLFIADETHIIRQDIVPKAVGQGIGGAYVTFPHGSLEQFESDGTRNRESLLLQGHTGALLDARQFLMYVIRPLDHPLGWLVGASYRTTELTKLFAEAALGFNPVVALVDTKRGVVQSVVGPAARRPKTDLTQTALFAGISRRPSGTWLGDSGIDDVQRINAFHRVADRDMAVVVGANYSEVMASADSLASLAHTLASVATALVVCVGGLILWELYTIRGHRRQKRASDRNRSEIERLRSDEDINGARAHLNATRLQVVLDNIRDGIALFDSNLRLVQWNRPFLRGIGIDARKDMPLDAILREQAAMGLFGPVIDVEAEIAHRVRILRGGDLAGVPQPGAGHETLNLRGLPIGDVGFMLLLGGLTTWQPAPSPASWTLMEDDPEPAAPVPAPAVIDW